MPSIQHADIDHTGLTGISSGSVATDSIWDAAGDLAVGSDANTAAKLAKGAAGANLSSYNGVLAWNGGTSFPASPTTGDRYWRSDHGREYYYDGTRWLSTTLYSALGPLIIITAANTENNRHRVSLNGQDVWLVAWTASVFVSTTNNGSNNWTIQLGKRDSSDTGTSVSTISTSAMSPNTWTEFNTAIGAAVVTASFPGNMLIQASVKTGTPGNCLFLGGFTYRLIAT